MGINPATLYRWKDKYCEICNALKRGKEFADIQVENAMFKNAIGHMAEEVKEVYGYGGELESKIVTKKYIPPNVTAGIFWLKNRRRSKWTDRPTEKPSDEESQNITFEIVAASKAGSCEDDN